VSEQASQGDKLTPVRSFIRIQESKPTSPVGVQTTQILTCQLGAILSVNLRLQLTTHTRITT